MILYFLVLPFFYVVIKLLLHLITWKFGKISYDGFSAAGFKFDHKNELFYSAKNAWQRKYGYCHLYDVVAPLLRMIIDTEPVKFYYNNSNWLITFWKGQYGITTGAEIGIYKTNQLEIDKNTLYLPVKENEMLDMSIKLYKKGHEIMSVKKHHWWLAVFKLGMFSNPKNLTMDISITFPNVEMMNSFLTSFQKLGYKTKDFEITDTTFSFTYKKPHTHKVWTRGLIRDSIIQSLNHRNVKLYDKYIADIIDDNKIDDSINNNNKLIMVNNMIPEILINNDKNNIKQKSDNNTIYLNENVYSNKKVG